MTKSSPPNDLINQSFDTLEDQLEIASDIVDSINAGIHRFDAMPSLSSQLTAIEETLTALKLIVIPSETNEIRASYGNTILENEYKAIDANNQGGITKPAISAQAQIRLLNAAGAQIVATRDALSCVLSRLSGDTLAGRLAGRPNKKTLEALLGGIDEQIGVVNKLFGTMQLAYLPEPGALKNTPDHQPLDPISTLLNSIKTALDSISVQCLELDLATDVLERLTPMMEADEQTQLCPLIESLRDQAADLEESKALLTESLHKAARAYIQINGSRRNALAPVDPKAGMPL